MNKHNDLKRFAYQNQRRRQVPPQMANTARDDKHEVSHAKPSVHSIHSKNKQKPVANGSTCSISQSAIKGLERRVERGKGTRSRVQVKAIASKPLMRSVPDVFKYIPDTNVDLAIQLLDFETEAQANKRRKSLVKFIERYRQDEGMLREALASCDENERCRLQCCPVCMRAMRRWLCGEVGSISKTSEKQWTFVTLVAESYRISEGMLDTFNPQQMFDLVRKAVKRYGPPDAIVFGAVDFCEEMIGVPGQGQIKRVWALHLQVCSNMNLCQWSVVIEKMRKTYCRSKNVNRPTCVKALDDRANSMLKTLSYCVKSNYYSAFAKSIAKDFGPDSCVKSRRGRPLRMHGKMQAELASTLARWRRKDRVLLIGLKGTQKSIVQTGKPSIK